MTLTAGLVIPASLALLAALSAPWQPAGAVEATGSISGTVISATTHAPVGNVPVTAISPTTLSNHGWAVTGTDGTYLVTGLPSDNYYVQFRPVGAGFATERYNNVPGDFCNPATAGFVSVATGQAVTDIDAELSPGGLITGTVLSGVTGAPVPYPQVRAVDASGSTIVCGETNAQGQFWLRGVPVGYPRVQFLPPADNSLLGEFFLNARDLAGATPVEVFAGQVTGLLPVTLDDPNGDHQPPAIALIVIRPSSNDAGWWTTPVAGVFTCTDVGSGPVASPVMGWVNTEGSGQSLVGVCEDNAGNVSSETMPNINVDWTPPTIEGITQDPPANTDGWVNSDATVTWTCADTLSGPKDATRSAVVTSEGANQNVLLSCTDVAGNTATGTHLVSLDRTPPMVSWVNPITDGASFPFGDVPPAPTCSATDSLSGDGGCGVTGYATTAGSHDLTATAVDRAGNLTTARSSYTVLPWTLVGFRSPVSMTNWNVVKAGAAVPLKFEVFAGAKELTDIAVVRGITAEPTTCPANAGVSSLTSAPIVSTLAYDTERGFFTYNWKAPRTPGACLNLSATTVDGSHLTALVQIR